MTQKFIESKLSKDFCKEEIKEARKLIQKSIPFTVVGMPGVGISTFLGYLVTRSFAHFIHVDLYKLVELKRVEFWRLFLKELGETQAYSSDELRVFGACHAKLSEIVKRKAKLVIVFNRFDQLKDEFTSSFFSNLRIIKEINKVKLSMIFSSNKNLYDWSPQSFARSNLEMYSKSIYLKPYREKDFLEILRLFYPSIDTKDKQFGKAYYYSGGHLQLFHLVYRSNRIAKPMSDEFVKLQLKRIYEESFSLVQRKRLEKIAYKKPHGVLDEYLFNVGILKKSKGRVDFFSPLMSEYIRLNRQPALAYKEKILFAMLKKNFGKIVTKEEIFTTIWKDKSVEATDWALNALVYRLRVKLKESSQIFQIEGQKKIGYRLVKN